MTAAELKTLRRNTDATMRDLTETVNGLLDKIEELSQKLSEVEDERDKLAERVEDFENADRPGDDQ